MHNPKTFYGIKNIFRSRYFDTTFWKYKGLNVGFELQMYFLENHTKCINSLRN